MLAVDAVKARCTLANVTDERVAPVGLADFTRASIVAGVWVAGSCNTNIARLIQTLDKFYSSDLEMIPQF